VFLAEIDQINPADLVYMDESGIDASLQRNYARAKRETQIISDVCGKKTARTSLIAAWIQHTKSLIAPYVFDGYTDATRFNGWLEKYLLPELRAGQVVVMDNAAFHRGKRTKELIESVGCRLLYLPPYSPDFNPIEHIWAVLKAYYKTAKQQGLTHHDAVNYAFKYNHSN
jgi:isftu1 transposase